jgi:hypothetical protein
VDIAESEDAGPIGTGLGDIDVDGRRRQLMMIVLKIFSLMIYLRSMITNMTMKMTMKMKILMMNLSLHDLLFFIINNSIVRFA